MAEQEPLHPWLLAAGDWLVRWRRLVLCVVIAACLGLAWLLPDLRVGFRTDGFFRSSDPQLRQALQHYGSFAPPDNLLLFAWAEAEPLAPSSLARLQRFAAAAARHDCVRSVITPANAKVPGSLRADPAAAAASATFRRLLVARQGDAVGGIILLERSDDLDAMAAMFAALRAAAAQDGKDLNLCGLPFHRVESRALVRRDLQRFLPIGTAVSAVFLFWLLPSALLALLALLVVPLTLCATLATMAGLGVEITMLTSTLPVLLLCMSIADGVHMVGRFLEERARGHAPAAAASRTFAALFVPCLMTSLTTVVGFLTLCVADLRDLRQLGGFAALGMGYAFLLTMTILPAAMAYVAGAPPPRRRDPAALVVAAALRLQRLPPRLWVGGSLLLVVLAAALCTRLQADHRLTADLWPDSPVMVQMRFYEERFVGVVPAEIVVRTRHGFGAAEREQLARLCRHVEAEPGVSRTLSVHDLWTDGLSPLLVQGLAAMGTLPAGLLADDGRTARVLVFREDLGTAAWERFAGAVDALAPSLPDLQVHNAGFQMVGSAQVSRMTRDLGQSFFGSIGIIFVLVLLQCRSVRLALVAVVSCLVPLVVVLAGAAVAGVALRPLVMIAFCIAFGLMIDGGIHLIARWQEERRAGADPGAAVQAMIRTAGRPVAITTLLLLVGFAVILDSEFRGTSAFGLLVVLSLVGAAVSALVLLPALLRLGGRRAAQDTSGPP